MTNQTINHPRPKYSDEGVLRDASSCFVNKFYDEFRRYSKLENIETIIEQLNNIPSGYWYDGYDLAVELEKKYNWDICASFIEILDYSFNFIIHAQRKAEKEWVTCYKIVPLFSAGQYVEFCQNYENFSGEITKIDLIHAKYHIRTNSADNSYRKVIDIEDCRLVKEN